MRDQQIDKLSALVKELQSKVQANPEIDKMLNTMEGCIPESVKQMIQEETLINDKIHGRRYSENRKSFAKTLYGYSPKAYHFVSNYLSLPSHKTLQNWIAQDKIDQLRRADSELEWTTELERSGMRNRQNSSN